MFQRYVKIISLVGFNAFLLFCAINLLIPVKSNPLAVKKRAEHHLFPLFTGNKGLVKQSYGSLDEASIHQIKSDFIRFDQKDFTFEPYIHFSEPTHASETLNVIRGTGGITHRKHPAQKKARWPYSVYTFGGSTTFGWNVRDDQTVPFYLQGALKRAYRARKIWREVRVTNYGKTYHSWFDQLILFQRLLNLGERPKAVVFINGVNVPGATLFPNSPYDVEDVKDWWDEAQIANFSLPESIPLFRWANEYAKGASKKKIAPFIEGRHPPTSWRSLPDWLKATRRSYLRTKSDITALAKAYNIKPYFVWEPNRAYLCQEGKYPAAIPEPYRNKIVPLYAAMKRSQPSSSIYLGNLCRSLGPKAYLFVDRIHYSPDFNLAIAEEIAKQIARQERRSLERKL